jgi:hypothetical protein
MLPLSFANLPSVTCHTAGQIDVSNFGAFTEGGPQAEGLDALKHGARYAYAELSLSAQDFSEDMGLISLASGGQPVYAVTPDFLAQLHRSTVDPGYDAGTYHEMRVNLDTQDRCSTTRQVQCNT